MTVICKIADCRYNNEGICGAGFIGITQHGMCEYIVNRDGSLRNPSDWASPHKEKCFQIEYPEWHDIEEEEEEA